MLQDIRHSPPALVLLAALLVQPLTAMAASWNAGNNPRIPICGPNGIYYIILETGAEAPAPLSQSSNCDDCTTVCCGGLFKNSLADTRLTRLSLGTLFTPIGSILIDDSLLLYHHPRGPPITN